MALTENDDVKTIKNNVSGTEINATNEKTTNNPSTEKTVEFDGDIDLSVIHKKVFRIDGDSERRLELNISDMGIINRLNNLYPRLHKLSQDAALQQLKAKDSTEESFIDDISRVLVKIDMEMREILDEIFDSNVSEVCAPEGTMFDPFNGQFRFEHIIDVLSKLYANNLNAEFKKMSDKMKKRVSKYTKGK